MSEIIEKRWWAYSKKNPPFDIVGYSKAGSDYRDDVVKAMEVLAKYLGEPIPSDVELCMLSDNHSDDQIESESYSG